MLKKPTVVFFGLAVSLMTASFASAQAAATPEAKDKTKATAQKTAEVVTDADITSAVKAKLLADKTVGGLKIDVDTRGGVVTLTGPVHSAAQKNKADTLARHTRGVKHVDNKLTVETATSGHKEGTTDKIKDDTKAVAEKTKEGAEKAGKATEKGAEKAAKATEDAAIKTKDVVADASITADVKTKLLASPKVGGLKIDVDTKDNVVTLTGNVSSVEEKNEALHLAKNTMGVKKVVDKLTVK